MNHIVELWPGDWKYNLSIINEVVFREKNLNLNKKYFGSELL